MRKPPHPSGSDHPNFKDGRYVGAKAKDRVSTPRTGATLAARQWITSHVAVGGHFMPSDMADELHPMVPRRSALVALGKLRKEGMIVTEVSAGKLSVNRRLR